MLIQGIQALFNILLCPRNFAPYDMKIIGIGIMATAKQPRSVPAHCTPRFSNIWAENNGKPAATAERSMMLAATVEAALYQMPLAPLALEMTEIERNCD